MPKITIKNIYLFIMLLLSTIYMYGAETIQRSLQKSDSINLQEFVIKFMVHHIFGSIAYASYWSHRDICALSLTNKLIHQSVSQFNLCLERKKILYNKIICCLERNNFKYNTDSYASYLIYHCYGSQCRGTLESYGHTIVVLDARFVGDNTIDIISYRRTNHLRYD